MQQQQQTPISNIKVGNTGNVTSEQVLAEANGIWADAKKKYEQENLTIVDTKRLDDIYNDFYASHKNLFMAYPTVMRHMLQEMQYSSKAFEAYLKRLTVRPWLNDEQRLDSYADYAVLLYKALNPKYNPRVAQDLRGDYRKRLQDEHDSFKKRYEKHRRDVESDEKRLDSSRRDDLRALVAKMAADMGVDTTTINKMNEEQLEKVSQVLSSVKLGGEVPVVTGASDVAIGVCTGIRDDANVTIGYGVNIADAKPLTVSSDDNNIAIGYGVHSSTM